MMNFFEGLVEARMRELRQGKIGSAARRNRK